MAQDLRIIKSYRKHTFIELDFNRDLTIAEVQKLRQQPIRGQMGFPKQTKEVRMHCSGLFGNPTYQCYHCNGNDHLPNECPAAQEEFYVFHVGCLFSRDEGLALREELGASKVTIGTIHSQNTKFFSDHLTVTYPNDNVLISNASALKQFVHRYKCTARARYKRSDFLNVCKHCGHHKCSSMCQCDYINRPFQSISASERLRIENQQADDMEINMAPFDPWPSAPDRKGAAHANQAKTKVQPVGKAPKDFTSEQDVEDHLIKHGLVFEKAAVPLELCKAARRHLESSTSGWSKAGNQNYVEKFVGATDLHPDMAISYHNGSARRKAERWHPTIETVVKTAAAKVSRPQQPISCNGALLNRFDGDRNTGAPHMDREPECAKSGYTMICAIEARDFYFQNTRNPQDCNHQRRKICMSDGDVLLIPRALNYGRNTAIFHRKGAGLEGGTHFSIVGKHYDVGRQSYKQ